MPKSVLIRLWKLKVLRKCLGRPFLSVSERLWPLLAARATSGPTYVYGSFMQSLIRLREPRTQYHGTYFFRNRPELQLIRFLLARKVKESKLRIAVLACSNGAEVYSIQWTIRSARPDLDVKLHAVDISSDILEIARKGVYSLKSQELMDSPIFERLTADEMGALFDIQDDRVKIRSWIKEGINWMVADAGDPQLANLLGRQDIVIANRFLCHMNPPDAERCLRNIGNLVAPGGYLFVSGIDLDVRTKVATDLGWTPVETLLEEIHNGDPSLRRDWPWKYWGLEPFNPKRRDWRVRYASVFQLGQGA
ncbi:MAG TPA: CheR family methyltransferase [Terriglobales bacterium]|nr:CheR family methyltransferase [Terriglobales bacterium]